MLKKAEQLITLANKVLRVTDMRYVTAEIHQVEHLAEDFTDSEKHYLREENVLFPYLEKHGITEPPAVMWMEHNEIRELKKNLHPLIKDLNEAGFQNFKDQLWETAKALSDLLQNHFYKENNVLFPAAMSVVTEEEWREIRREFDEIGYCCFTPPEFITIIPKAEMAQAPTQAPEGTLQFETGALTKEQLDGLLNALPVDITFVDADDTVRYFNKPEERLFVRTKAVLGRKVHMCHPQKSLHVVSQIVESFKNGKKNVAEFWINLNNRFVHIRFFAVRDADGKYLGTMEVVQDLTDIKQLKGERRLLDWDA
jgi:PAS domain S-box-containing protein